MSTTMSTKKKTGLGVAAAAAAALAIAGGTLATFSDTEPGPEATVSAGTLDLVPGENASVDMFTVGNIAPGYESPTKTFTYTNEGSVNGSLDITFDVVGAENGCNEPEQRAESTCNGGAGELTEELQIAISDAETGYVAYEGSVGGLDEEFDSSPLGFTLTRAGTDTDTQPINVRIWLPEGTGNRVQSDSVTVTANAVLEQSSS